MSLYSEAVDKLFSARIEPKLWAGALFAYVALDLVTLVSDTESAPEIAVLLFPAILVISIIVMQWKLIITLSDAPNSQPGSVVGWIGWSLLSFLVYGGIPIVIVVGIWGVDTLDHQLASPLLTVVIAVIAALVSPMLVQTTGQVIDGSGTSSKHTLNGCRPFYLQ